MSHSCTTQMPAQYTLIDYTQTLDDAGLLGSIETVGDAYAVTPSPRASSTASEPRAAHRAHVTLRQGRRLNKPFARLLERHQRDSNRHY